jgi:8-oxo-dGTP diphosphatase
VKQLVGAGVACLGTAGQLLMVRRRDNGLWDLPGGRVEVGEATQDAAARELLEETGLQAHHLSLLEVLSGPDTLHTYPDGNTVAWVTVIYSCREWSGEPQAADDAAEIGWFELDTVPGPVSAATGLYLDLLRRRAAPSPPQDDRAQMVL